MGKIGIAGVLRLRARSALSRDPSVRRFAQDDDSVGELTEAAPTSSVRKPASTKEGDLCTGAGAHRRSLGFARDDKGEGGDFYWGPLDRMDRRKQQVHYAALQSHAKPRQAGRQFVRNSMTSREKSIKSQPLRMTILCLADSAKAVDATPVVARPVCCTRKPSLRVLKITHLCEVT